MKNVVKIINENPDQKQKGKNKLQKENFLALHNITIYCNLFYLIIFHNKFFEQGKEKHIINSLQKQSKKCTQHNTLLTVIKR